MGGYLPHRTRRDLRNHCPEKITCPGKRQGPPNCVLTVSSKLFSFLKKDETSIPYSWIVCLAWSLKCLNHWYLAIFYSLFFIRGTISLLVLYLIHSLYCTVYSHYSLIYLLWSWKKKKHARLFFFFSSVLVSFMFEYMFFESSLKLISPNSFHLSDWSYSQKGSALNGFTAVFSDR